MSSVCLLVQYMYIYVAMYYIADYLASHVLIYSVSNSYVG